MENPDHSRALRHAQPRQGDPHHPSNLLWATHTVGAMVARADSRVARVERLALAAYLRRCEVEALKSPLARGLFGKCLRELERDPASEQSTLARVLAGFKGTPWAWVILRAAEHVAAADGKLHDAEIRALDAIRTVLNVPRGVPERYAACGLWPSRP
jgi:tellurite resistance protein